MEDLSEIKKFLKDHMEDGTDCPACEQFVKLYKRKLNSSMSVTLLELYRKTHKTRSYIHVNELEEYKNLNGGGFATLKHWGLIEECPKDHAEFHKKSSGYWKITQKGVDFCEGKIKVKQHVLIYNQKAVGFSEEEISITESLKDNFNYSELMAAR
jgi:hypothetical protein